MLECYLDNDSRGGTVVQCHRSLCQDVTSAPAAREGGEAKGPRGKDRYHVTC